MDYTQLIEQLRLYPSPTIHRAADAIEALQARVNELTRMNEASVPMDTFIAAIEERDSALAKLAAQEGQTFVGVVDGLMRLWTVEGATVKNGDKLYLAAGAQSPTAQEYMTGYSDGKAWADGQMVPLTKAQIDELYLECGREVAKLDAEDRYTFAAWFPIAIRLAEKAHGIGGDK